MLPDIQEVTITFDVYLSSSKQDTEFVSLITDKLQSNKSDIRIFNSNQTMNVESVWQEDMYEVMSRSARVITGNYRVLTKVDSNFSCQTNFISFTI